ncbi:hypothetical protein [Methanoregula sp.]|uniref:hypothetical protein n=1 Tax=Methanoregula sp. TaxID=2052170 RepID=UPI0035679393
MLTNEKKIRLIRDRLTRIGIGERCMSDDMILASYSINNIGQLCSVQKPRQPQA